MKKIIPQLYKQVDLRGVGRQTKTHLIIYANTPFRYYPFLVAFLAAFPRAWAQLKLQHLGTYKLYKKMKFKLTKNSILLTSSNRIIT